MTSNDDIVEKECCEAVVECCDEVIATMTDPDSDDGEDNGAWSFESDHAALKNNSDYMNLLRTLTMLQAQRLQTVKDLETLREIKRNAIEDPVTFLERMQNGEDVGFPVPMTVAQVPHINWTNYRVGSHRHARLHTRRRGPYHHPGAPAGRTHAPETSLEPLSPTPAAPPARGRPHDDSKPSSFNQLWSPEEQGRLEQLLAEYPAEENEQSRYRKIAAALGNRSGRQVSSRVQKYFLRLHHAGLPVPGRTPTRTYPQPNRFTPRLQKNSHLYRTNNRVHTVKPSSFFPARAPALMDDQGGCTYLDAEGRPLAQPGSSSECRPAERNAGDEADSDEPGDKESEESEDDGTMNIAEKVERARAGQLATLLQRVVVARRGGRPDLPATHHGYKCDVCQEEPIVGTRWHCTTCTATSYDFCDDCVVTQAESKSPHPLWHNLEATMSAALSDSVYDEDYGAQAFARRPGDYNYLDPNFMPL